MSKLTTRSHASERRQAGDTLVEVLISIAVISLVLAAGYATTNRNVSTNQDTQERSQALQVAQRQIELLRSKAQTTGIGVFHDDSCLAVAGSTIVFKTDGDCNFSTNSTPGCNPDGADLCYNVAIQRDVSRDAFMVKVTWPSLSGGTASIALDYRV